MPTLLGTLGGAFLPDRTDNEFRDVDPNGDLARESRQAGRFAGQSRGQFGSLGGEARGERDQMRRLARGQDSVSALQLRQALQQNQSAQASMAAGARPGQGAMAARTAMENSGRLGAALSGQQAVAGLQERQAAQNSLNQMLMQQRQQELQAALGSQGQAFEGYGQLEQARAGRFGAMAQTPTPGESLLGGAAGLAGAIALSDRRLKKGIKGGEKEADSFLKALTAHRYSYKDEGHGKGEHLGIMAQDLERTELGKRAVIDTPAGKAVHGARLATMLAATLPGLDKRLAKLEGKGR